MKLVFCCKQAATLKQAVERKPKNTSHASTKLEDKIQVFSIKILSVARSGKNPNRRNIKQIRYFEINFLAKIDVG